MAPSTFASAAAGNNQNASSARDGGSEWSRRTNGATHTFRRPSATNVPTSVQQSDPSASSHPAPRYVPPHRNGTLTDTRYSKEQLLDLYKAQQSSDGGLRDGLTNLYVGGWQPELSNGATSAGWGRAEQSRDAQPAPDICWDREGSVEPLGLIDMDDDERELFLSSVNTPLKPPNSSKEGQQSNGLPGRKVSMSSQSNAPGGYGPLSPTTTRAPGRRRETSESFQFPQNPLSSPTGGFNRDEQRAASPPPSLQRRRTDLKDSNKFSEREADADDKAAQNPFGSLKRTTTGPLTPGFGAPSSPWANAPTSAGLSPMGSFGSFGLNQQTAQADKRPALGSGRAESRFKNLLSKDANEEPPSRPVERKTSMSSLARVNENESWRPQQSHDAPPDEMDEELPSGSAALAADDLSPPQMRQGGIRGFGTPSRTESRDDYGFGAFGMTSDNAHGFGQAFSHQTPSTLRHMPSGNEPMSPTDTNPYQSPEQHGIEHLTEDLEGDHGDLQSHQLPGLGGFPGDQHQPFALGGLGAVPNLGRMQGPPGSSDRSQTSSAGANRGFPGLGGLGSLGGMPGAGAWPTSQGGLGTPSRQTTGMSNAFGGGIFATSTADVQSPSLAGLGGAGLMSPHGNIGGSRMASMFPPAMQDQMRQGEQDRDIMNERTMQQQYTGQNDFARAGTFGTAIGDAQAGRGEMDQLKESQQTSFGAPGQPPQQSQDPSRPQHVQSQSQSQIQSTQTPSQPPPPQQRTMVMPDRMRWIYRDPQGQTQGPWSGLEMHDWYKAGFFSPELLVKKYEDPEYEPLAQLIRRIGNSREPFLVPQIGIPHGSPSNNGPNAWAGTGAAPAPGNTGAQPPFASSFPSFGTTLTADQQNALERRKQEEQYLMARQKEHLAQQQIAQRMQQQMHHGGPSHGGLMPGGGQLQHHSSAQSLHSQPSFGSMTSPSTGAFQPSPVQAPQGHQPGFFDHSFRGTSQAGGMSAVGAGIDNLGHIREEEIPGIMDRLTLGSRAAPGQFGAPGQPFAGQNQIQSPIEQQDHERQVQQMLQDRARLQQEQAMHDAAQASGAEQVASNERLQQFQQLQSQGPLPGIDARFQPGAMSDQQSSAVQSSIGSPAAALPQELPAQPQELTLTEQVQKAASAQQSPVQPQFGLPQPFPPAPSQSPLPAPAAQRHGRQSVADQLQTEERDLSQTPSVDTPSAAMAPWAKETVEAQKGPSLKEIQEAEAKKAAEEEAMLAAARRAAFEKEMEAQSQAQTIAPAPGLPATASWANSGSPLTPTGNGGSPWAKAAQKITGPATAKSMAQIQKEEEARKKKLAAAALAAQANAASSVATASGGKSYANLAGKITTPPVASNAVGGAWTTVGAGGKPKTPAAVPPPATARAVSSGIVPTMQSNASAQKKPLTRSTATSAGSVNAHEEFRKWAIGELRPDLNKGIPVEEFISNLIVIPMEVDMLTEAVHSASSTIDSRHFAEEFIRRKKLADKGLIDTTAPPKSASPHGEHLEKTGGWSEVAKKGPVKEASTGRVESDGSFRVVAAKKKGGKR